MAKKYYGRSEKEELLKKIVAAVVTFVVVCSITVVIGHAVDADDRRALHVAQQPRAEIRADEARCARDEDGFSVEGYGCFFYFHGFLPF